MTQMLATAAAALMLASVAQAQTPVAPPGQPAPGVQPLPPGSVVNTPHGPDISAGGTSSYQQLSGPNGAGGILIPNSNGTSTITSPTGGTQVVPTPR